MDGVGICIESLCSYDQTKKWSRYHSQFLMQRCTNADQDQFVFNFIFVTKEHNSFFPLPELFLDLSFPGA